LCPPPAIRTYRSVAPINALIAILAITVVITVPISIEILICSEFQTKLLAEITRLPTIYDSYSVTPEVVSFKFQTKRRKKIAIRTVWTSSPIPGDTVGRLVIFFVKRTMLRVV
jgi:hypothetical protein